LELLGRLLFAKSVLLVFIAPIVLAILLVWSFLNPSLIVVFSSIFLIIYFGLICGQVGYDGKTIGSVEIPNAPDEVKKFLKTTTNDGDLLNVILLRSFRNNEPLSQTDMTNYAQRKGSVGLTSARIREYIKKMEEEMKLISSQEPRYTTEKKEYRLTEPGKWCRTAVRTCFPERLFMFWIRNGLGLRRLSKYPEGVPAQSSEEKTPESF